MRARQAEASRCAQNNNQHGCGKKWYPGGAIEEGEWLDDNFVGDFGACDAAEALATAIDAEQVAQRAREFLFKPDGGALLCVNPFRVALTASCARQT